VSFSELSGRGNQQEVAWPLAESKVKKTFVFLTAEKYLNLCLPSPVPVIFPATVSLRRFQVMRGEGEGGVLVERFVSPL
jgi:hypothetical protein